ncbi:conserved hypothetical protein [Talaromyces stipitatus ATCC 10500]|uniref:tRNA-splicing endonuclease subunit Sen15 domain-containing protein n=1 Tax=Talaromyces stipitatus (strain ATCC 10500 / CBS 375.48 / QM 6759 / NRRL 1006) TaxID=441959 RepID=B8M5Y5_TALSN|nr:uncharacterized protein TSTA_033550 [Talaromyces stipitatus ATCC 10500]EED20112.1 conserved hypothetical protein [Talaromyces stipitatus ATCC 10500]
MFTTDAANKRIWSLRQGRMPSSTEDAPKPSALTTLISTTSKTKSPDPLHALTTQVYHNLQHQHLWTSLRIHNPSDYSSLPGFSVPLISGIPPQRMYTHPDEQLCLLDLGLREEDLPSERLWVLPSTQGQTWTLGKLATVFDALPPRTGADISTGTAEEIKENVNKDKEAKLAKYFEKKQEADKQNKWGGKRLLLAMVDRLVGGDGTVVYYVVQEGHVKPRQN